MEIKYRIADLNDLDGICGLVNSAIDTMVQHDIYQWDDMYPTREDFREDIEKKQLYTGMAENRMAVVYVLNREYDEEYENGDWKYRDEPIYIVHRLCVDPAFQNRGIAKHTLSHIEEELKAKGVHTVRLDVFSKNPFALKLYNDLGYSKAGCVEWKKGLFYLMEKHI